MRAALVDPQISQASLDDLAGAYRAYRETLPKEEASELEWQLQAFEKVKTAILGFEQ